HPHIGVEFGDHLARVGHVIPKNRGDEGHDEGVLRRLFGLGHLSLVLYLDAERRNFLGELHNDPSTTTRSEDRSNRKESGSTGPYIRYMKRVKAFLESQKSSIHHEPTETDGL